jgi:DNA-binding transcriptional ArsR family regulator
VKRILLKFISHRSLFSALIYTEIKVKNMAKQDDAEFENLEQEVFKALENQKRRDILRLVGEKKGIAFTEILDASKVPDSPTLSYHLRSLAPFMKQVNGKYSLTPIGKDAYSLLLRTATYNKLTLLRKKKREVILGNALIWGAAIAAAAVLRVDAILSSVILPILAANSLSITYKLFE